MVTFDLPEEWPTGLINAIPAQRLIVNKLLATGVIQSYSVSADRTKVWMVLVVEDDQFAVDQVISTFPILDFVEYQWEPLLFTNDSSSVLHYSLN
ncbi:MAG: hypothetical protein AB8F78_17645 [Saprospiraceae bacterium]